MFADDVGQQLHRQGSQDDARRKVLDQAAKLMRWVPERRDHAAQRGDHGGNAHGRQLVVVHVLVLSAPKGVHV
jgi:hypothetical protein